MKKARVVNYDDIKIKYDDLMVLYSEESGEFLFIQKKRKDNPYGLDELPIHESYRTYVVDAISQGKIETDYELEGFKPFNKELILEKGRDYTPNELLVLYNMMLESKVNFTFSRGKQEPEIAKKSLKEYLEINDDTEFDYEDLEVRCDSQQQSFYFLKIEYDEMMNMLLYDAISGARITPDEISSYRHFDKALILEKGRTYLSKEIANIYKLMNFNKVNFTFQNSSHAKKSSFSKIIVPEEITATDDTKFKYDELEARINYEAGSLYFLVKKVFTNDNYITKTARYDAINGQRVSDSLLSEYEILEKKSIFPAEREYTSKEIAEKYRILNDSGVINSGKIDPNSYKKSSK